MQYSVLTASSKSYTKLHPRLALPITTAAVPGPTAELVVDLAALQSNYRTLCDLVGSAVGAVVKANAYGLGLEPVVKVLAAEGCQTFFTAFTHEALALRAVLPSAEVYVFSPQLASDAAALISHDLKPCLYDRTSVLQFCTAAKQARQKARAALHVETGINRLGVVKEEVDEVLACSELRHIEIDLVMSHLACADEPDHALNARQLTRFRDVVARCGNVRASLANSAGIFLGDDYHFDLVRPGIALFGHDPHYRVVSPRVQPVASLRAPLGQIKTVAEGEHIGYGATVRCDQSTTIGVILAGYADGIPRCLTEPDVGHHVGLGGATVPLLGRASMDLITADLSELADGAAKVGCQVEFFGSQVSIEAAAEHAGTIPYEILTGIGSRVKRSYLHLPQEA